MSKSLHPVNFDFENTFFNYNLFPEDIFFKKYDKKDISALAAKYMTKPQVVQAQMRDEMTHQVGENFYKNAEIAQMLNRAHENLPHEQMQEEGNRLVDITLENIENYAGPISQDWKHRFRESIVNFYKINNEKSAYLHFCKKIVETVFLFCHDAQGNPIDEATKNAHLSEFVKSFNFLCVGGAIGEVEKFYQRLRFPNSAWLSYNDKLCQETAPYVREGNQAHLPALFDYVAFGDAGGDKNFNYPIKDLAVPQLYQILQKTSFEAAAGLIFAYDLPTICYELMAKAYNDARDQIGPEDERDIFSDALREAFAQRVFELFDNKNIAHQILRDLRIDYVELAAQVMQDHSESHNIIAKYLQEKLSISQAYPSIKEDVQDFIFQAISAINAIRTFALIEKEVPVWLQKKFAAFLQESVEAKFLDDSFSVVDIAQHNLQNLCSNLARHIQDLGAVSLVMRNVMQARISSDTLADRVNVGETFDRIEDGVRNYVPPYRQSDVGQEAPREKIYAQGLLFHPQHKEIIDVLAQERRIELQNPYFAAIEGQDLKFIMGENIAQDKQKNDKFLNFLREVGRTLNFIYLEKIYNLISQTDFSEQFAGTLEWIEMEMAHRIFQNFQQSLVLASYGQALELFDELYPWLAKAQARGNPDAQLMIAYYCEKTMQYPAAAEFYTKFCYNPRCDEYTRLYNSFRLSFDKQFANNSKEFSKEWYENINGNSCGFNAWFWYINHFNIKHESISSDELQTRLQEASQARPANLPEFDYTIGIYLLTKGKPELALTEFLKSIRKNPNNRRSILTLLNEYVGYFAKLSCPDRIRLLNAQQRREFIAGSVDYIMQKAGDKLSLSFINAATRCFEAIKDDKELLQKIDQLAQAYTQDSQRHHQGMQERQVSIIADYFYARKEPQKIDMVLELYEKLARLTRENSLENSFFQNKHYNAMAKIAEIICDPELYQEISFNYKTPDFVEEIFKSCVKLSKNPPNGDFPEMLPQIFSAIGKMLFCKHLNIDPELKKQFLSDYPNNIEVLNKAVLEKNYEAANYLANMHYYGIGVNKDYEKALHLYKIAAYGGHAEAQYNLGYCYFNKIGTPQLLSDDKLRSLARDWFEKAIEGEAASSAKAQAYLRAISPIANVVVSSAAQMAEAVHNKIKPNNRLH